jgi:hypothetical protein
LNDLLNKLNSLLKNKNNDLKSKQDFKYDLIRKIKKYFEQIKEEFDISFYDDDKNNKIFTNVKEDRIHEIIIKRDKLSYSLDLYSAKKYNKSTKNVSPIYIYRDLIPGVKSPIICWSIEDIQMFYDKREIILKKMYNKIM